MRVRMNAPIVPWRTLVVEDHKAFLDHICSVLRDQPDLLVIGRVQNGLEAVEKCAMLQPDLVILDIGLPGLNGVEAARRIRSIATHARIVFLTQESSVHIVQEALQLGACGYILKASPARDLNGALQAVLNGTKFVSEEVDCRT